MLSIGDINIIAKMGKIVRPIVSLSIFTICILKYFLINILELVPKYGDINRVISWVFIFPLTIVGLIISMIILIKSIKNLKSKWLDILLILPMILYVYYIFIYL